DDRAEMDFGPDPADRARRRGRLPRRRRRREGRVRRELRPRRPRGLTYREMIERVARLRGRDRRIVEVPVLTPRLSSYWLHLVTPVGGGGTGPLVEGLRTPTVVVDDRIRRLFPRELKTFGVAAYQALVPEETA